LSSLIVHDKTFYRVAVTTHDDDNQTLTVRFSEDKSPRGKIAFKVYGSENFKHDVTSATLQGSEDKTIYFSIALGMDELPIGEYVVSSGYLNYGQANRNDFSTSFGSLPACAIKADETTTVELGKPQVKIAAIELNKRYNSEKEYKTEFAEGSPVYIDVSFAGMAKETYRGFQQRIQKENDINMDYIKAQLAIVDGDNNTIVSENLEPG
jgi:uncharacterized protein (DUF2141 family)